MKKSKSKTAAKRSSDEPTVFVVDDDQEYRRSLRMLVESVQLPVETFSSAAAFLEGFDPDRPGCLVLDVRMPGISGLALQRKLSEEKIRIPIIILTAHGDVPMSVEAMRTGAVDFIEKPHRPQELLERVRQALDQDTAQRRRQQEWAKIDSELKSLTPREREVLNLLIDGKTTKEIAHALRIGLTTVDFHRSHVFAKMQVDNTVKLTRLIDEYRLSDVDA